MTFYLSFFMIFFFSCLKLKSSWMQSLEKNLFWLSCQSCEKSHFHCVVTALLYVCMYFTRLAQFKQMSDFTIRNQTTAELKFICILQFCLVLFEAGTKLKCKFQEVCWLSCQSFEKWCFWSCWSSGVCMYSITLLWNFSFASTLCMFCKMPHLMYKKNCSWWSITKSPVSMVPYQ